MGVSTTYSYKLKAIRLQPWTRIGSEKNSILNNEKREKTLFLKERFVLRIKLLGTELPIITSQQYNFTFLQLNWLKFNFQKHFFPLHVWNIFSQYDSKLWNWVSSVHPLDTSVYWVERESRVSSKIKFLQIVYGLEKECRSFQLKNHMPKYNFPIYYRNHDQHFTTYNKCFRRY